MKMFLEKIRSEGLSHLSYIIGHGGRAAVIDPRQDCEIYLEISCPMTVANPASFTVTGRIPVKIATLPPGMANALALESSISLNSHR